MFGSQLLSEHARILEIDDPVIVSRFVQEGNGSKLEARFAAMSLTIPCPLDHTPQPNEVKAALTVIVDTGRRPHCCASLEHPETILLCRVEF